MTVLERIRDVGLLRAAGATRGQVQRFILVQAVVVGVLGSLLGLALGAVLAALMTAWLRHDRLGDPRVGRRRRSAPSSSPS